MAICSTCRFPGGGNMQKNYALWPCALSLFYRSVVSKLTWGQSVVPYLCPALEALLLRPTARHPFLPLTQQWSTCFHGHQQWTFLPSDPVGQGGVYPSLQWWCTVPANNGGTIFPTDNNYFFIHVFLLTSLRFVGSCWGFFYSLTNLPPSNLKSSKLALFV